MGSRRWNVKQKKQKLVQRADGAGRREVQYSVVDAIMCIVRELRCAIYALI